MELTEVRELALKDGHNAVDSVRGHDGPIVWLTGNSFMPPLREIGSAETVWQCDDEALWEEYFETFEMVLENNNVYLGSPEYDNALYGVDLSKWEYSDDGDSAEYLSDEWVRRSVEEKVER